MIWLALIPAALAYIAGWHASTKLLLRLEADRESRARCHKEPKPGAVPSARGRWNTEDCCVQYHLAGCWRSDPMPLVAGDVIIASALALFWPAALILAAPLFVVGRMTLRARGSLALERP